MQITLNGQPMEINGHAGSESDARADGAKSALTVRGLLHELGYGQSVVAIAINREFVPRHEHAERTIQTGDHIDIVAPMQGG